MGGKLVLSLQESVHIEEIASGLDLIIPQLDHGLICFVVSTFAEIPTRRLGAQKDKANNNDSRHHC